MRNSLLGENRRATAEIGHIADHPLERQSSQSVVAESKQLALSGSSNIHLRVFHGLEKGRPLKHGYCVDCLPPTHTQGQGDYHSLLIWCKKCAAYPESSSGVPQTMRRDEFATGRLIFFVVLGDLLGFSQGTHGPRQERMDLTRM